nr:ammonia-dependent NAD(+) synthetase [Bacillus marinisedimentorum]
MDTLQDQIIREMGVKPEINPKEEVRSRIDFLKNYLKFSGQKGYVLGISGGQDSTLAGKLAQLAVNEMKEETGDGDFMFMAVRLPYGVQRDEDDARKALEFIDPDRVVTVNIQPAVDAAYNQFKEATGTTLTDFLKGNTKARERMKVQYDLAGRYNLLVIGTDHAAEAITGFYTKHGDGACDIVPLFGLHKGHGKQMLIELEAEERLYMKVPTADLEDDRPGLPDEEALGITYKLIDDYLEGKDIGEKAKTVLENHYLKTRHKRNGAVSIFDDWWK